MRIAFLALAFLTAASSNAFGQNQAANEKAIRDIVARMNAGQPPVDVKSFRPEGDEIFWSSQLVKPQVGTEEMQLRPGSSAGRDRRSNTRMQTQIVQLHISSSGDMAYEYSTFKQAWTRNDDQRRIEVEGALLRTWRKRNGLWLAGAIFQVPYDNTPNER